MAERNIFTAGVQPGGLTTGLEVRLMICYLLYRVGEPMSFTQLNETFQRDGLVNYFEFAQTLEWLCQTDHVKVNTLPDGTAVYSLQELGVQTARTFERSLPRSVREKAVESALQLLTRARREQENLIEIQKVQDGFQLRIRMIDIGSDLMDLALFVPTMKECEQMKEHFLEDPISFYQGVLTMLQEGIPHRDVPPNGEQG